jgi:hypothetical protein
MKTIVACLLTALAVAGVSEARQALITGKQIKDGSVGLVDLNRATRAKLVAAPKDGKDGAPGKDGQSIVGPQGAQGPEGKLQQTTTVTRSQQLDGDNQGIVVVTVACPPGQLPVSGGHEITTDWKGEILASHPTATGWRLKVYKDLQTLLPQTGTAYAQCAD